MFGLDYLKLVIKKSLFAGLLMVLVLALVVATVPLPAQADPDTDAWGRYPIPEKGEAGGWVLTSDVRSEATGVTAIAVAFDSTIYAATEEITGSPLDGYNLFQSTDGGYSWEPLWKIPAHDNPNGDTKIISLVLPDWEDTDTLYLATEYNIYKSTDGGEHFISLGRPPLDESALITSFDVTDYGGTHLVVVSTRDADNDDYGGVYFYDQSRPFTGWADLRVGSAPAGTKYDVLAVAFPPNFTDDEQVVAVVTDEENTIVTAKLGSADWGTTVGDAYLLDPTSGLPGEPWAATGASLAFPADYDSDVAEDRYMQYVGLDVGGVTGGIYMIMGVEAPDDSIAVPVFFPAPVHSLAAAGEAYGAGVIVGEGFDPTAVGAFTPAFAIAGLTDGSVVSIATGIAYTPPSAYPAENTVVALGGFHGSGYFVYAGTSGINGGFARSVDTGATFARTAFICDDLETITDIAVSPIYRKDGTAYMITEGHSGNNILWRTTDRGQTWDAVLTEGFKVTSPNGDTNTVGAFDKVAISPRFASDTTVFISESGSEPGIWRSVDNGFRFSPLPSKTGTVGAIDSWVVVGIKEVLVGDNQGDFYKTTNGGLTWSPAVATGLTGFSSMALSPDYDNDQTILAGDGDGNVYLSTDDGETWHQPADSATSLGGGTVVAFSPHYTQNRTIYAADSDTDTGILRFVIGKDTRWQRIDRANPERIEEVTPNITGLYVADDGDGLSVLYATNSDPVVSRTVGTSAAEGGVARCLNPAGVISSDDDAPLFEMVNSELPSGTELTGLWYAEGHRLWSIDTAATPMVLYAYEGTLTVPLQLDSPVDGASSGRQTSGQVSWQAISRATSYEIWYDTAPSFNQSPARLYSEVARADITGLESGVTYYWRVRVGQRGTSILEPGAIIAIGAPVLSRFSGTWSFTTALGGGQWSPFTTPDGIAPLPGATSVAVRPTFHWDPADRATAYELVVARDSEFADVVIARVGDNALSTTVWASDSDLDYGTTYYWKVRAVSATSYSQWAVGIFTTESAPLAPSSPPPPSPPPPPAASGTPVSIWVILAIITVLIMVLLVLIMTTRRSY